MIDKNVNYIKYFLEIIKEFDESTVLNTDLNGIETPNLVTEEFKINKYSKNVSLSGMIGYSEEKYTEIPSIVKKINDKLKGCNYCKYIDICYKRNEDEVELKEIKNIFGGEE